jgi:hypothetical protein
VDAFDSPEFWNPKVKGAECLNRHATRSILPIADMRPRMVMAGHSKAEIVSAIKAAFDNKQLLHLINGALAFMMSKSAYLYGEGDHNGPCLMFFTPVKDSKDWVVGQFPVTRQTRHKATFATPLSENMNEDFMVESHVGLLGEGTDCSRPTKAINIGNGPFQPDAPNLRAAITRGSRLLDLCSKTMLLNPRRK